MAIVLSAEPVIGLVGVRKGAETRRKRRGRDFARERNRGSIALILSAPAVETNRASATVA